MKQKVLPAEKKGVYQEEYKVFLIFNSHAIVKPLTVVVHAEDAPFALGAVVRPWRFERFSRTLETKLD